MSRQGCYDLVESQQFQYGLKNSNVSAVLSEAPLAKLSHKLSFLSRIRKAAVTKLLYGDQRCIGKNNGLVERVHHNVILGKLLVLENFRF